MSAMEMLVGGVCEEDSVPSGGKTCKSVSASVLLRKLRWSSLGLQFDWSKVSAFTFAIYLHASFVCICYLYYEIFVH